jgi:hypothetical protein
MQSAIHSMNNKRKLLKQFIFVVFVVVICANVALSQRDRSDRPGTSESRAVHGKEVIDRKDQQRQNATEFFNSELQKHSGPLEVSRFRAAKRSFTRTVGFGENEVIRAVETAKSDYKNIFKQSFESDPTYGETHALIRLKDFARAYVIALDPAVAAKFRSGLQLAEERSMVTTYHSYEEILEGGVPTLAKEAIKQIVREAKDTVDKLIP